MSRERDTECVRKTEQVHRRKERKRERERESNQLSEFRFFNFNTFML